MSISKTCNLIFQQVIDDYHLQDFVDAVKYNPYSKSKLFEKMNISRKLEDKLETWSYEKLDEANRIAKIIKIK